jgi:hypothetical protein
MAHIQNTNSQYNYTPFGKKLSYAANREEKMKRFLIARCAY